MTATKTKPFEIGYKAFRAFLEAVYNISRRADLPKHLQRQDVTGGSEATKKGKKFESTLLKLSKRLLREANRSETRLRAAREAARVFLEITSVENPQEYLEKETRLGIDGQRVGSDGATVVITATSLSSVRVVRP